MNGRPLPLPIVFACVAGDVPVVRVHGEGITRAQWESLRAAVDEAWSELQIPCACGHAFGAHASRSPHACYSVALPCPCATFRAALPIVLTP